MTRQPEVEAVIFDLDGVLVDTEPLWAAVRRELTLRSGGSWTEEAAAPMLGMSGPEWSAYMHDSLGVPLAPGEIHERVVAEVVARIGEGLAPIPGASEAVARIAERWPIAVASSADRPVIQAALSASGLGQWLRVIVTSEDAGRGKPAPDVFLLAAERLEAAPAVTVAVEDSANGMRAVKAAGMRLIAIPNPSTHVDQEALALADRVLESISQLTPEEVTASMRDDRAGGVTFR
ncbi:MAG TPA: HAD family phosphatase [Thermoleophilaceae bacterium]|nr:HAD family phosphatase [Thermoleophilaceae bacterium]